MGMRRIAPLGPAIRPLVARTALIALLAGVLLGWLLWGRDHRATPRIVEGWAVSLEEGSQQLVFYGGNAPPDGDGQGLELAPFYLDLADPQHPLNRSCLTPQRATRVRIGLIDVDGGLGSKQAVSWVECLPTSER
jgi:hypothetical protein